MAFTAVVIILSVLPWLSISAYEPAAVGEGNDTYYVCQSQVCQERAKLINASLNVSIDPCEDFYSYVCGGFISQHEPKDGWYGVHEKLAENTLETLKSILEDSTTLLSNESVVRKAAVFYSTCMAFQHQYDQREATEEVLTSYGFSDWPLITEATSKAKTWANATEVLLEAGISSLFRLSVQRNKDNMSTHVIRLEVPSLADPASLEVYRWIVSQLVNLTNPTVSDEEMASFSESIIEMEKELINLTKIPRRERAAWGGTKRITIDHLEINFTNIPLLKLVKKEFSDVGFNITENEQVDIRTLYYYKNINEFLTTVDPKTLYNYAGVQAIYTWAYPIISMFAEAYPQPDYASDDAKPWKECLEMIRNAMPEAADYIYVKHKFSPNAKAQVEYITQKVREAFVEVIGNATWMDNATAVLLEDKVEKMDAMVGYSDQLLDHALLESLYQYIPILDVNSSFVEVYAKTKRNMYLQNLQLLRHLYEEDAVSALDTNAYHFPERNEIALPAALLQAPYYQPGLPWSLNFGSAGGAIGHEMAHGFDTEGIEVNVDGTARDLLDRRSRLEYDDRALCLEEQYDKLKVQGTFGPLKVNGGFTLDENIADNCGLQIALLAYIKTLEEGYISDVRLVGLEHLSGLKLFFVGNAMTYCRAVETAWVFRLLRQDPHSPDIHRVNVPAQNLEAFARAFNCSKSSAMYKEPNERCILW